MDSITTAVDAIRGIRDSDRQRIIARKMALNEAYYNVGLIDVIETKAVSGSRSDRNKLILCLRTTSRGAFDVYNIDKGFFGKFMSKAKDLLGGGDAGEADRFTGWSETEIHHYVMTRIEILKAVIGAGLSTESKLRIVQRVANIRRALIALIDAIGR